MTDPGSLRRTPLHDEHVALNGRMVPFAGYDMPVQYTSILEEARSVRNATGIFDISHMGRVDVIGAGALAFLQRLTTNDVSALEIGQGQYSLLPNPEGGLLDDIIVYRTGAEAFRVVVNASNAARDLEWMRSHCSPDTTIIDRTDETAMVAVQGPGAVALTASVLGGGLADIPRFGISSIATANGPMSVCRTGYTGEDGFEVTVPVAASVDMWRRLIKAGATPCGLGARDALRIEAGYPLYGHEINETTLPVEAGLMWVVKLDKGDFPGREAMARLKEAGPRRRLMGVVLTERIIPRQGYTLYAGNDPVGVVTSGVFSPTTERGLGMAYIDAEHAKTGLELELQVRGARHAARVVPKKNLLSK